VLEVATPSNTIVFGSDRLTVLDMVRGGALPTLAAVLLLILVAMVWVRMVMGSG
jgi:solute carrier family 13 (sodium-dependent dicarboxylate transporter), member 2/3/5